MEGVIPLSEMKSISVSATCVAHTLLPLAIVTSMLHGCGSCKSLIWLMKWLVAPESGRKSLNPVMHTKGG